MSFSITSFFIATTTLVSLCLALNTSLKETYKETETFNVECINLLDNTSVLQFVLEMSCLIWYIIWFFQHYMMMSILHLEKENYQMYKNQLCWDLQRRAHFFNEPLPNCMASFTKYISLNAVEFFFMHKLGSPFPPMKLTRVNIWHKCTVYIDISGHHINSEKKILLTESTLLYVYTS